MTGPRIVVDRIACDGAGVCAHLAPATIALDPWGYPMVGEVTDVDQVRRAIKGCPRRALHLVDDVWDGPPRGRTAQSSSSS